MTFKGHFSYFKLVNYQNLEIILRTNYFTTVTLPLQGHLLSCSRCS